MKVLAEIYFISLGIEKEFVGKKRNSRIPALKVQSKFFKSCAGENYEVCRDADQYGRSR